MALHRIFDLRRSSLRRRKEETIILADRARDTRQWELAAEFYKKVLDHNPRNPPIWVQYGHALKEWGDLRDPEKLAQAETAYRRALALDPAVADIYLQLGHVLKLQGRSDEAAAAYLRTFALEPSMRHPLAELAGLGWSESQLSELRVTASDQVVSEPLLLGSSNRSGGQSHAAVDNADAALAYQVSAAGELAPRSRSVAPATLPIEPTHAFGAPSVTTVTMDDLHNQGAFERAGLLFDVDYIHRKYNIKYETSEEAMHAYFSLDRSHRFDPSSYFSRDLYVRLQPDLPNDDPLEHYLFRGRFEKRCPHPLFNTFLAIQGDNTGTYDDIYFRFLAGQCNHSFHELIDLDYVGSQQPRLRTALDIFRASCDPDAPLTFSPHPLFDPEIYKLHNGSFYFRNELVDFISNNDRCVMTHPLFDPVYYVQTSGISRYEEPPLLHYLRNWESFPGDVSPFVDMRFLNHQIHRFAGSSPTPPMEPLSFALTHQIDADVLLHRQIDGRVIDRTFSNQLNQIAGAPQAQRVAKVVQDVAMLAAAPEETGPPLISVVMLNYYKPIYTFFAILAVLNSFGKNDVEVIVIENGGELSDYEFLKRYFASIRNVKLIKMQDNKYFGEGSNIGTDQARGQYILYLNNDCFLSPDYAQYARAFLSAKPDVHAVGALLLFPDGTIQEFGGLVSDCGTVIQRAKGMPLDSLKTRDLPEKVDYVSAACLLLSRSALNCVAGFDLAFEPFYYDDTDLCKRLNLTGFDIFVNPKMTATHIENASTREYLGEAGFYSMVSEHKDFFSRRWLKNRGEGAYVRCRDGSHQTARLAGDAAKRRKPVALVYTPFDICPGGGERYLLTTARALSQDYEVILCSKELFSKARVLHVLAALGIPEFEFDICGGFGEISARRHEIAVSFVMGNEIVPPVPPIAAANLFHLQFPFPWRNVGAYNFELLSLYEAIIVNSEFTKKWASKRIGEVGLRNPPPILMLHPPIRVIKPSDSSLRQQRQGLHLITVGRFFTGGHSKRQDIFLDILDRARQLSTAQITATLVGSVHSEEMSRNYYTQVKLRAESMQGVEILVDGSEEELASALSSADIYVHCAGFDVMEQCNPEAMEHFGMSIVEALTAGCVPLVYGAGGPVEIIQRSGCGFCYQSVEQAARLVVSLLNRSERRRIAENLDTAWVEGLLEPAFTQNLRHAVSLARSLAAEKSHAGNEPR
jgi:GT2 family glycosyltransferase/glycosyltransferase involved in cell wall biosynthesis/tetratricopeptide (TPR) repeat protein